MWRGFRRRHRRVAAQLWSVSLALAFIALEMRMQSPGPHPALLPTPFLAAAAARAPAPAAAARSQLGVYCAVGLHACPACSPSTGTSPLQS